jgi:type I restriction enzyme, S subunit
MKAGWVAKSLHQIGTTSTGSTPKTSEKGNYGDFIPFVKPADFNTDGTVNYENGGLSELGLKKARCVPAGSVLMVCIGATIGKCGFCERDVTTNQQINSLKPFKEVFYKFVYYQMLTESFQQQVFQNAGQATLPIIIKSKWSELTISFPSLPEQQRIVGILDEAFVGIATAKANTERNLQNARALFESHLQSVFNERSYRWEDKPLAELCDPARDITYGVIKLGEEVPDGVPCLRTSNVRWLRIDTDGMKRIAPSLSEQYARTILKGGEVLVNVRGTLGGVSVAAPEMVGWNVSREVAVVPVDPSRINSEYLTFWIGAGVSQKWLGGVKKGAAYIGINLEDLRMLPVKAPEFDEQAAIVRQLNAYHEKTLRLESIYQQKLTALEALKMSLLNQAFTGQL